MNRKRVPNNWAAANFIANLEEFRNGKEDESSFHAKRLEDRRYIETGYLPNEWRDKLQSAIKEGMVDYVVYSYFTPIGWHYVSGEWEVPTKRYSVTTSGKHMPVLHSGIALNKDKVNAS